MSNETTDRSWLATLLRPVIFLIISGSLFAFFYPIYLRMEQNRLPNTCQSNLKLIGLGYYQYLQDYDQRFPPVAIHDAAISAKRPLGWADALQPYLKSTRLYQCPFQNSDGTHNKPSQTGYTDYWYNAQLSGIKQKELGPVASILVNGEGNDGTDATNARYCLHALPTEWKPSVRHLEGANYAFADGHVKWLRPEAVTVKKPDGRTATFAVK
jgi:prepilin-type processing-associated H-X9-DG protein